MSVSELARRSDVSQSFLSQVESGQSDISVGRLVRLTQALDIDAAELLGQREVPTGHVVRAGEHVELPSQTKGLRLYLLAPSFDHARTNVVGTLEPGAVVGAVYNRGSETFLYILEGTAEVGLTGGRSLTLGVRDSVSYRSEEFERMSNPGTTDCIFLWVQAATRR